MSGSPVLSDPRGIRVLVGGVRGSRSASGSEFRRFGEETLSILLESQGARVVVDVGSGFERIRQHVERDPRDRRLLVMLSHHHLDHLVGLPSLFALVASGWSVTIQAPTVMVDGQAPAMRALRTTPFWPIPMLERLELAECRATSERPAIWGDLSIRSVALVHPGGCLGYRVDLLGGNASAAVLTDFEWRRSGEERREAVIAFLRTPRVVDVLLCDGAYSDVEYQARPGWGHNTWRDAVEIARTAGARKLWIIHHAPELDDAALRARARDAQALWHRAGLARAGQTLSIGRRARNEGEESHGDGG